jgi:hypothetical protein
VNGPSDSTPTSCPQGISYGGLFYDVRANGTLALRNYWVQAADVPVAEPTEPADALVRAALPDGDSLPAVGWDVYEALTHYATATLLPTETVHGVFGVVAQASGEVLFAQYLEPDGSLGERAIPDAVADGSIVVELESPLTWSPNQPADASSLWPPCAATDPYCEGHTQDDYLGQIAGRDTPTMFFDTELSDQAEQTTLVEAFGDCGLAHALIFFLGPEGSSPTRGVVLLTGRTTAIEAP